MSLDETFDQTFPQGSGHDSALRLAALFGAVVFIFHIAANLWQTHLGYGYFRDELYYLICGRHLAWGYVDHGPMVAVQARVAETFFGRSLAGLRLLAGLAGGLRVLLTGLLTYMLGGRRAAQTLAMICVFVAPQYLAVDGYLSMNSWESVFWMTCLIALIQMVRSGCPESSKLWMLFGLSAGLGLLNKPSMTFFLVALLLALLATSQRRLLWTPWTPAGIALMLAIVAPNILWQVHHHWPTWEFLENGKTQHKNVILGPLAFLNAQFVGMHPLNTLVWLPGLVWLLRQSRWRWLGLMYVVFLTIMMVLHAKDYYVIPVYPILFAAGGVTWQTWRPKRADRLVGFPVLASVLLLTGAIILPMSTPVMTPTAWLAYTKALHLYDPSNKTETMANGPLPQFYADRFGWQEEVDQITRVYRSLSPEDQRRATILCTNYGEASAVNFLGHGLPVAISGQNNYWLWGTHGATGEVVIAVTGASPQEMLESYAQVQVVGRMDSPYAMPYEHRNIYLARDRKQNLTLDWPDFKNYI
jgi:hypothetical protein